MIRSLCSAFLVTATAWSSATAGVFLFAESQENPNLITYPSGYTGTEPEAQVSICIHPDSESISEMDVPLRNIVAVWNALSPVTGNLQRNDSSLASDELDFESVLLHEMGHCVGLAHPNLASESNLSLEGQRFAKSLPGTDGYSLDSGTDGVIGSRDDQRGDDINLIWFQKGVNDPFVFADVIDGTTFSTDLTHLPAGHAFAEIAALQVAILRGLAEEEAVMHQGTRFGATRRELSRNDASMIRLAQSGLDRAQDTQDDFLLRLDYQGVKDGCDITVKTGGSDFAFCEASASLSENRARISVGNIFMGSAENFNWHFNTELREDAETDVIFADRFEPQSP